MTNVTNDSVIFEGGLWENPANESIFIYNIYII